MKLRNASYFRLQSLVSIPQRGLAAVKAESLRDKRLEPGVL